MKLTKTKLKQIIKEELNKMLNEDYEQALSAPGIPSEIAAGEKEREEDLTLIAQIAAEEFKDAEANATRDGYKFNLPSTEDIEEWKEFLRNPQDSQYDRDDTDSGRVLARIVGKLLEDLPKARRDQDFDPTLNLDNFFQVITRIELAYLEEPMGGPAVHPQTPARTGKLQKGWSTRR